MITLHFQPTPPYDFAHTIRAGSSLYIMGVVRENTYRRAIRIAGGVALIEASSSGTIDRPQVEVTVLAANREPDEAGVRTKVRRILNIGADLRPFYAFAQPDPVLWATVQKLYGLHSLQSDSLFEALVLTMIEQQIALKMAQTAERWLIGWAGDSVTYAGETYYAFPSAERIAALTVEELTPLKITFRRMQRIIDLAQAQVSGQLDLEALRDQPFEALYETLIGLNGVGHWTAAWTLVRARGVYPYVASSDVALQAAVNYYYFGLSGRADVQAVNETFARYGKFGGIAAYYTLMRWAFERYF